MSGEQPRVSTRADDGPADLDIDLTQEQQRRITEVFARLRTTDFYDLLSLPKTADRKEIKRAYSACVSELHPDRFFRKRLGPFEKKIEAIFIRMTQAHDVLCSPEHRARYDAAIRTRRDSSSQMDALLQSAVADMEGATERARREEVDVDRSVRVESDVPASSPTTMPPMHSGPVEGRRPTIRRIRSRPPSVRPAAAAAPVDPEMISRLRALHEKRKRRGRPLEGVEGEHYDTLREALARALVGEHGVLVDPQHGKGYRQLLRVPCAFRLTLSAEGRAHNTITLDLSGNGVSTLVGSPLATNSGWNFVLHVIPDAVRGRARVVSCHPYGSGSASYRVSLQFEQLERSVAERLDIVVLDAALRRSPTLSSE